MAPDKDENLNKFLDEVKKLFVAHFKDETDIDVLTSGCSILVGVAIGYLGCYMGEEAAKLKVIEVIQDLEQDDVEIMEEPLHFSESKDIRNLN